MIILIVFDISGGAMQGNSKEVSSTQDGVHPDLLEIVERHRSCHYQKPYSTFSEKVFEQARALVETAAKPLILDSGCGIGESTQHFALQHPDCFVLGIDKSQLRLSRAPKAQEGANWAVLRADLIDFWRLAADAGWKLSKHYLLYPNPWPKKKHLQRRWHAHPVFPYLLLLGGEIELRSNWKTYLEEFSAALMQSGKSPMIKEFAPESYISPFERKYFESGQQLYRLEANC